MITPQYPNRREHTVLSNLVVRGSKVTSYQCVAAVDAPRSREGSIELELRESYRGPIFAMRSVPFALV
jgi:hypothetical protein